MYFILGKLLPLNPATKEVYRILNVVWMAAFWKVACNFLFFCIPGTRVSDHHYKQHLRRCHPLPRTLSAPSCTYFGCFSYYCCFSFAHRCKKLILFFGFCFFFLFLYPLRVAIITHTLLRLHAIHSFLYVSRVQRQTNEKYHNNNNNNKGKSSQCVMCCAMCSTVYEQINAPQRDTNIQCIHTYTGCIATEWKYLYRFSRKLIIEMV